MRASKKGVFVATTLGIVLAFASVLVVREATAAVGAGIVNPVYASNSSTDVYYAGQNVTSTLQVKNSGTVRSTFCVRYGVRDGAGRTYNVATSRVELAPGATSTTISKTWTVPDPSNPSTLTTGPYGASFSVYGVDPATNACATTRLDSDEKANAFKAFHFIDQFNTFDSTSRFTDTYDPRYMGFLGYDAAGDPLYTTYLDPANVGPSGAGQMRVKLPTAPSDDPQGSAKLEGGQLRSKSLLYRYGTYEVRMKLPDAPSSLTGFFLYYGKDYEDEIDIELFNNGDATTGDEGVHNREVWFTTYAPQYDANGNPVQDWAYHGEKELPFDPTAAYHTYRFDYYPGGVGFYVDGVLFEEFPLAGAVEKPMPTQPMQIIVNAWYPKWMSQTPPGSGKYLEMEWLRH